MNDYRMLAVRSKSLNAVRKHILQDLVIGKLALEKTVQGRMKIDELSIEKQIDQYLGKSMIMVKYF